MAPKTTNFTREGTPFDVFQIGKNYTEVRQQIMLTLEQLYEDYKKEGVIYTLGKYENIFMSGTFLHKLVDLGIIKTLTDSEGNIQYEWNSGDNPDITDLTNKIMKELKF
jgi:hypothetical protein